MKYLIITILLISQIVCFNGFSQNIYFSDSYRGFVNFNRETTKENVLFSSAEFVPSNMKIDTLNNLFVQNFNGFLIKQIDGSNAKKITPFYTSTVRYFDIYPIGKTIYFTADNQIIRLSYTGVRDTILKRESGINLNELVVDSNGKKIYYNINSNDITTLYECNLDGSNQKFVYSFPFDSDLVDMQFDAINKRIVFRYWQEVSKIGSLSLHDRRFQELHRVDYGSIFEFFIDGKNDILYFVNTRTKDIQSKDLRSGQIKTIKKGYPAEITNIFLYKNDIFWFENNYHNRAFYYGRTDSIEDKNILFIHKNVPLRFTYDSLDQKIVGRINDQVVSSNLNGDSVLYHSPVVIYNPSEIMYYNDRLYLVENTKKIIASSKLDGSDLKVVYNYSTLSVLSALIDPRSEYIYFANKYHSSIDRIKIDGSGYENFWLSTDWQNTIQDIVLDNLHNKLLVSDSDCKCVFAIDIETKERTIIKSGTSATFFPDELTYNSKLNWLYINDSWNKKIYRMRPDGTQFTTIKTNHTGPIIKQYDEIEVKLYGILGSNAEFYEFDVDGTKTLAFTTDLDYGLRSQFVKIPGKDDFYYVNGLYDSFNRVYSINSKTKVNKPILQGITDNLYSYYHTLHRNGKIYSGYVAYFDALIRTDLSNNTISYYPNWPKSLKGIEALEDTSLYVGYTEEAIIKININGQILDTIYPKDLGGLLSKRINGMTYNRKDQRIYFAEGSKKIQSVDLEGIDVRDYYTSPIAEYYSKYQFDVDYNELYAFNYSSSAREFIRINKNNSLDRFPVSANSSVTDYLVFSNLPHLDNDGDGLLFGDDCNDEVAVTQEIANNGIDEDCDGEDLIIDIDGDGHNSYQDCDDNNENINPNAIEIPYNGIDDDCDKATLDDDIDQDGFLIADDCNDENPFVNPNALERPYNGLNDDCNDETLDDDLDEDGFVLLYDCNDNNAFINPNAPEVPYNGLDDDCNMTTLDDDLDQDGFVLMDDCNDLDSNINPNAIEIPGNGMDENCDGNDLISSNDNADILKFDIYPNPSSNYIFINSTSDIIYFVKVYDIFGNITFSCLGESAINVSDWCPGFYYIELSDIKKVYLPTRKKVLVVD